jgi:hypothetical protein
MFEQALLPKLHLREFDKDGVRFYQTPVGDLPSVTTVLGTFGDMSGLESWRGWIDGRDGEGTADKITHQSSRRGNAIHKIAEKYLQNDPDWKKGAMPVNLGDFLKIKGMLDANVKKVFGLEYPIYSDLLRTAGRVDIIVDWNSFDTIIDLKTTRRPVSHTGEKLLKWQYQATTYAMMLEEHYHKPYQQCIIINMISNDEPQLFIFNNEEFREPVREIFKKGLMV